jgi:hypothetical protein
MTSPGGAAVLPGRGGLVLHSVKTVRMGLSAPLGRPIGRPDRPCDGPVDQQDHQQKQQ